MLCDFQDLTLGVKRGEAEADGPGFERSCGLVRKRRAVQARAHTDPLGCKPRGKRLAVRLRRAEAECPALRLACKQTNTRNILQHGCKQPSKADFVRKQALRGLPPLERRDTPEFHRYFNAIWKELDVHA